MTERELEPVRCERCNDKLLKGAPVGSYTFCAGCQCWTEARDKREAQKWEAKKSGP